MSLSGRRLLAAAAALVVLALDLAQEMLTPTSFHHARSPQALALTAVLALAVLWTVSHAPSRTLIVAGGVAAGGAFGNVVSGLVWRSGVPDPIVRGGYAFNLADVAVVLGDAALLTSAIVVAWANRDRLRSPV